MPSCSAYNCNRKERKGTFLALHRFPVKPEQRLQWAVKVNRLGDDDMLWMPTDCSRLCSAHFTDDCYQKRVCDGRYMLKPDSVPTLFSHTNNPPVDRKGPPKLGQDRVASVLPDGSTAPQEVMQLGHAINSVPLSIVKPAGTATEKFILPHPTSDPVSPKVPIPKVMISTAATSQAATSKALTSKTVTLTTLIPIAGSRSAWVINPKVGSAPTSALGTRNTVSSSLGTRSTMSSAPTSALGTHNTMSSSSTSVLRTRNPMSSSPTSLLRTRNTISSSPTSALGTRSTMSSVLKHSDIETADLKFKLRACTTKLKEARRQYQKQVKVNKILKDSMMRMFEDDQMDALQRRTTNGMVWSRATIEKGHKLRFACGNKGYQTLIDEGYPLPSIAKLQRDMVATDKHIQHLPGVETVTSHADLKQMETEPL